MMCGKKKGNLFGFIGVSVSFIDNDWNYFVQNLSPILFAWSHKVILLVEPIFNVLENHFLQEKDEY
ncbi:hypothetical protein VP01_2784g2 [Puccinia sorghi]|uniref:Uncharacterized protein n=1 Tax=Puccinia sorghi TaxID=27349 RepID=A0A0L6V2P0_9BASI|nr:hypothetical protein VP01_2784g2 [Puccinia sorghi]